MSKAKQVWLEQPNKTLVVAGTALVIGAAIVIVGLNILNWSVGV